MSNRTDDRAAERTILSPPQMGGPEMGEFTPNDAERDFTAAIQRQRRAAAIDRLLVWLCRAFLIGATMAVIWLIVRTLEGW